MASIAADATPHAGQHVLTHETVILDLGPEHLAHLDTIVDPLVVTDLTTVVWAPHGHWQAVEALRRLSQCVLARLARGPRRRRRAASRPGAPRRQRYVVDLAWLRSTPWRERIATLFDPPAAATSRCGEIAALRIRKRRRVRRRCAAPVRLAGLAAAAGAQGQLTRDGRGRAIGTMGEIDVALESVRQDVPGLGGVTIGFRDAGELSLDRGPGGLTATSRDAGGNERHWRLLGASRGEGGILGEGIRQSLLRDRTYREALDAAAGMLT